MKLSSALCWITIGLSGLGFGAASSAASSDDTQVRRLADLDLEQLAEIPIVSAARHEQSRQRSPRWVSVMTAEEIRRRNFRNVPEAVAELAGVYMQQTNYGGGSPILRGMIGNRILLMVNGIRMNNGTYRLGPNQYLNAIDIEQVERIEVVRGAGSVLYGSDAFGGVINVITKAAPDPRHGAETAAQARVRFASGEASGSGRVQVAAAHGKLGLLAGYTQDRFGDLRGGQTTGVQRNTGYGQSAGDIAFTLAAGPEKTLQGGLTRLKQTGVPRTDTLNAGTDLAYLWNPQGRDLAYLRYQQANPLKHIEAMEVTVSFQRPFEFLERVVAAEPAIERRHSDVVNSINASVQLTSAVGAAHVLTYGFEGGGDYIESERTDWNRRTGVNRLMPGSYPDASRYSHFGLYLQDEIAVSQRLAAVLGARMDRTGVRAGLFDAATGKLEIDSSQRALTGSGHLLYQLTPHLAATAGLAQGFRAPNIDDSTILGGVGPRFEIPNAGLKPERSVNFEFGLRAQGKMGAAGVVAFEDRYRDLIDRAAGMWNGLNYVDLNNNGRKDSNELGVFQRQNISRAKMKGIEFDHAIQLRKAWTWTHFTTWTYGTDTTAGQPLTRIPPLHGVSRLTWSPDLPVWVEAVVAAAMSQHRLAPADKTDIRIGPWGTPGYSVFHLRGGVRRGPLAGLTLAWENIGNRSYRLHGSGFARPGSQLVAGYSRGF